MAEQATAETTSGGYPIPEDASRFEPLRIFMRRFLRVRLVRPAVVILVAFVLIAIFVDLFPIPGFEEQATDENGLYISWQSPNADHPFGTDKIGRDTFSRVLNATRAALAVGFGASLFGAIFGLPIGIAAGYARGIVDEGLMRLMDAVLAFPGLILALALVSVLGRDIINIIVAVGIANIPWVARIARSMALSVREQDYVLAGQTIGASNLRIMMRYVLPNSFQPVIVQVSLGAGFAIIAEAGLSFLGLGIRPPDPTWGGLVSEGRQVIITGNGWWLWVFPGACIALLVWSLNIIGDGLRDVLDPRLRGALEGD
ncbi:MAG: ABC transporter permease [Chloroflexi bacterium]|nr:ABC transporter permease [Chloroflexota bacterium]MXY86173.1 ABC transporter permease [Chloroflexota bacterium]MYC02932.1 ABC transporter permease [Chloroflexota bacterium]